MGFSLEIFDISLDKLIKDIICFFNIIIVKFDSAKIVGAHDECREPDSHDEAMVVMHHQGFHISRLDGVELYQILGIVSGFGILLGFGDC